MTTPATNPNPGINADIISGYDPVGHQYNVLPRMTNVQTDGTTTNVYGDLAGNENSDNIVLLTSAAITANSNSTDQTNTSYRGIKVYLATGGFGASESTMTVTIQGKDPVSGNYFTILTSASLSASAFVVLTVYPGITASANVSASDVLPKSWRVSYAASNWGTGGSTLGIACAYIV